MEPTPAPRRRTPAGLFVWDGALFVIGFFVTTVAIINVPGTQDGDSVNGFGALLWLVSVGAWITVFFRRQHPVLTVVAGGLLAVIGTEYLLLLIGLHHVMTQSEPRARLRWGIAGGGTVVLFWLRDMLTPWGDEGVLQLDSGPVADSIFTGVIAIACLGATYALTAVTVGRRATETQRARADAEHTIATHLGDELARQSERSELAREIHDGLTNRLALVSMMGSNVERAVMQGDPRAPHMARELQMQTRDALSDLRALVQDLRTEPAAPPAPRKSMRTVGEVISATRSAGTPVDAIVILDGAAHAPEALDATVYRLVQETLTNAVKHAPGRPVSLYLEAAPATGVRLRVSNPVVDKADAGAKGAGAGLIGIRERASALSGSVWAGAYQGEFIVDVTLPWAQGADADGVAVSGSDRSVSP